MLYRTTRSKTETYTSHRVLFEDRALDGGFFVPFKMPYYDTQQLSLLSGQNYSQIIASVLNRFFSSGLTSWDVECCIGKTPFKTQSIGHKVILCHTWHNPTGSFRYIENALYKRLCAASSEMPTDWAKIAIRISVLFAVFCSLKNQGISSFDVTVNTGDFSAPMALWYAKQMGLPIGRILCVSNEDSPCWEFIHRGVLDTGICEGGFPYGLERLIYSTLGYDEVQSYLNAVNQFSTYRLDEQMTAIMNNGFFVSVVGSDRMFSLISSSYHACKKILDPDTAVSYGGLQNFRANNKESELTLMISEHSPEHFAEIISDALGLPKEDIKKLVKTV